MDDNEYIDDRVEENVMKGASSDEDWEDMDNEEEMAVDDGKQATQEKNNKE